jgi:general secretion pathway protein K
VTRPARRGEDGYALVAAIAAIALFAIAAMALLTAGRANVAEVTAGAARARAGAAADAGLMLAIHGLAASNLAGRWSIDGRPRLIQFGDQQLTITIAEENGKIPISDVDIADLRRLFAAVGVTGPRQSALVDATADWVDEDDDRRRFGAEAPDYAALGFRPANGSIRSVDELIRIRGMDRVVLERLRPGLTVWFGKRGGFNPANAQPLALAALGGGDETAVIQRQRELAGQRVAIDLSAAAPLEGRPLEVTVAVAAPDGSRITRRTIIELTGNRRNPWVIRGRI